MAERYDDFFQFHVADLSIADTLELLHKIQCLCFRYKGKWNYHKYIYEEDILDDIIDAMEKRGLAPTKRK